jgi:hypothetical protein
MQMSNCARPGCFKSGTNRCSTCLREPYCSGAHQRIDWKSHKSFCKIIKKLSYELQSYQEVDRLILEIRAATPIPASYIFKSHTELDRLINLKRAENPAIILLNSRVLAYLMFFAEYQLGARVPGKDYRERINGERMDNWEAEIDILIPICHDLVYAYVRGDSFTMDDRNLTYPYYKKMLDLLKPWSVILDLNTTSGVQNLEEFKVHHILGLLSTIIQSIATRNTSRYEFHLAETHCERALHYARLLAGK